jgi:hypothetical protein
LWLQVVALVAVLTTAGEAVLVDSVLLLGFQLLLEHLIPY